ncbi:hypothetical protein J8273_0700 [Carpediemonas membranifera]|uniref:Uncharacterized protein n=1 Tax=Carpediemonas membranifera TaxID=201153 RepID=A0A8J6EBK9_9EUKA|nr:hypothetical protein J8273_0700 [Carpediemonas membranifera]|eukprot:KAG9397570.1 hypothetical protein J8273_0700 [Carpediemonas membranifera]
MPSKIYTVKASVNKAIGEINDGGDNNAPRRGRGNLEPGMRSFTQAKYTFTCLLAYVSASVHALTPPRTVNLFDEEVLKQIAIAQQKVSKAKAADRAISELVGRVLHSHPGLTLARVTRVPDPSSCWIRTGASVQLLDDLGGRPPEPNHLEVAYGAALFGSAGTPSCAPYRHFAQALPGIMLRHNVVVSVTMVSEFRTSIVCPYCKAHFRRVVHTPRTMLCQNPACEGAPWRVERLRRHPEQRDILLNLSHRDKSASENIIWCTFDATSDQIEQSPFHYDSQRVLFLAIINVLS